MKGDVGADRRPDIHLLLDGAVLVSLILTMVFAQLMLPILIGAIAFRYVVEPGRLLMDVKALDRADLAVMASLAAFCTYFLIAASLRWTPYDDVLIFRPRGVEHPLEWLSFAIFGLIAVLRMISMDRLAVLMDMVFVPAVGVNLLYAVGIYTHLYVNIGAEEHACRNGLGVFNVNIMALFWAMMLGFGFAYFLTHATKQWMAWVLLGFGAFTLTLVTGSRMAIMAFALTAALVALFMPGQRLRNILLVFGVFAVTCGAALWIAELLDCGILDRFSRLSNATDKEQSGSTARRFELWLISLEELRGNWIFGLGFKADAELSYPNAHIHNQYLSWLVWGGVPGLLLALIWLLAAPLYGFAKSGLVGFTVAGAGIGFAGMNLATDSILYFDQAMGIFLFYYALAIGLARTATRQTAR